MSGKGERMKRGIKRLKMLGIGMQKVSGDERGCLKVRKGRGKFIPVESFASRGVCLHECQHSGLREQEVLGWQWVGGRWEGGHDGRLLGGGRQVRNGWR